MNNLMNQLSPVPSNSNSLLEYIQTLPPEVVAQLSTPGPEVREVMKQHLVGLLGTLPSQQFGATITTNRQHLGYLLVSAMMHGYFLKNVQQRMLLEQSLAEREMQQLEENVGSETTH